ncbi:D-serine/D-alanine/glycine transporter [Raoultella planticola]|uniref:D-serine/D-alanine/glycine transporter n=1 Tax=Raoultella planticola TaxID=575 RepID=A0A485D5Z9_RAOPL|nr:D-serine/D-alanine/glycine transporter [Raoultella planticola]
MTQHQREGQVNPAIDGECPSQLKRGLGARHIQMIALGGAIGTGLFMGGGKKYCGGGDVNPRDLSTGGVFYLYGDAGYGRGAAHPA